MHPNRKSLSVPRPLMGQLKEVLIDYFNKFKMGNDGAAGAGRPYMHTLLAMLSQPAQANASSAQTSAAAAAAAASGWERERERETVLRKCVCSSSDVRQRPRWSALAPLTVAAASLS